ncbi:MAG: DUF6461 domain-containing protein, partial [Dermatophilaceae bacterium]
MTHVPDVPDLTRLLGEGWCLTATALPPAAALAVAGVPAPSAVQGLEYLGARLAGSLPDAGTQVALAATDAGTWTLLLELEGTIGWRGEDPEVLARLTDPDRAVSLVRDPNRLDLYLAEGGTVLGVLDVITGVARGEVPPLSAVPVGVPATSELSYDQRAVHALHELTGLVVDEATLAG